MKYVIFREDDTCALTQVEHLDVLYRPFLDKELPINLAVIPNVHTAASLPDGTLEYFLKGKRDVDGNRNLPIGTNPSLVQYLLKNPGYHIVQHGYHHDYNEFFSDDRQDIITRLEKGTQCLLDAGFPAPSTFVAPQDKLTAVAIQEAARRFRIISTSWYESRRLPISWWPQYFWHKWLSREYWKVKGTLLLSRSVSYLSSNHHPSVILELVKGTIASRQLVILNTHWWEYFKDGQPDQPMIDVLHALANYLANDKEIKVITFEDLYHQLSLCGNICSPAAG